MENIYNEDGGVISSSRNMRGIRRYVSTHIIKRIMIEHLNDGRGILLIVFDDESFFENTWADYEVLLDSLERWRNVRGAPLYIGGGRRGTLSPELIKQVRGEMIKNKEKST